MSGIKGTKFLGNQVSAYGLQNHRVDYKTLSLAFNHVQNEVLINVGEWYLFCGDEVDENGEPIDVFQHYIIPRAGAEILSELTDEIVYYNEDLDIYMWCVTHFGTSWDYVLTDIEIEEE